MCIRDSNKSSDYSSIQTIDKEEEVSEIESSGSLYSNDEIRQIDSLNQEKEMIFLHGWF